MAITKVSEAKANPNPDPDPKPKPDPNPKPNPNQVALEQEVAQRISLQREVRRCPQP